MKIIDQVNEISDLYKEYIHSTVNFPDKEYQESFYQEFEAQHFSKGPLIDIQMPYTKGKTLSELISEGTLNKDFYRLRSIPFDRPLYSHQEDAINQITNGGNAVITTGTGSGKTESFLIPTINKVMELKHKNGNNGVVALFLYPMNALVNDQMNRVREILRDYPLVTFGNYTGDTPHKLTNSEKNKIEENLGITIPNNEILTREQMRLTPPNLLFTNYSMLEHLLIKPSDSPLFGNDKGNGWSIVILDEAHSYTGSLGIDISHLLKRLKYRTCSNPQYVLTSATLGDKDTPNDGIIDFAQSLTGSKFQEESIIFASRENIEFQDHGFKIGPEDYIRLAEDTSYALEFYEEITGTKANLDNPDTSKIFKEIMYRDMYFREIMKTIKTIDEPSIDRIASELSIDTYHVAEILKFYNSEAAESQITVKYHQFYRSLQGLYISLGKAKNVETKPTTLKDDRKYYEVIKCSKCNQMYLNVEVKDKFFETPDSKDKTKSNVLSQYFTPESFATSVEFEDENKVEKFYVCGSCGKLHKYTGENRISCCGDSDDFTVVVELKTDTSGSKKSSCPICDVNKNKNRLRAFSMGKDEATAILAQNLFESMITSQLVDENIDDDLFMFDSEVGETEEQDTKSIPQYLTFSDSRSQASSFAIFLQQNYDRIMRKRLVYESIIGKESEKINVVNNQISQLIESNGLFGGEYASTQESVTSILYELLETDGLNSGEGIGLYKFSIDFEGLFRRKGPKIEQQVYSRFMDNYNIDKTTLLSLLNITVNVFRKVPAVDYSNFDINPELLDESLKYRRFLNSVVLEGGIGKNEYSLIGKNGTNIQKYIIKALNIDIEKSNLVLKDIFNIFSAQLFGSEIFKKGDNNVGSLRVNLEAFSITNGNAVTWYECSHCKKIQSENINDCCVTAKCNGVLLRTDIQLKSKGNYYYSQYINKPLVNMVVKEHTAQLSKEKARKYQSDFKNQKINVLSSSTTFEMGIDLGQLQSVFLRNVPPTPANYVQRSGRAGRRSGMEPLTVTYCSSNSHDRTYFEDPRDMIEGKMNPPYFDVNNEVLILRHLLAIVLSFFFKDYPEYYGKLHNLFTSSTNIEGWNTFIVYLRKKDNSYRSFTENFLAGTNLNHILGNAKWVDIVLEFDGILDRFQNHILNEYSEIEAEVGSKEALENFKYKYEAEQRLSNLKEENTISVLSRHGVIPRYGFPVDTTKLYTYNNLGLKVDNNLVRSLDIGIGEYAPGSKVSADGVIYNSRFIKQTKSQNTNMNYYGVCSNDHTVMTAVSSKENVSCISCGTVLNISNPYLVPRLGFQSQSDKIKTGTVNGNNSRSISTYLIGDKNSIREKLDFENWSVSLTNNAKILKLNDEKFFKCAECGYSVPMGFDDDNSSISIEKEHKNHLNRTCSNTKLEVLSLAYDFETDVLSFDLSNYNFVYQQQVSILYALRDGISLEFNIDRSDIDCVRVNESGGNEIVIIDNVVGSAGHLRGLFSRRKIEKILHRALKVVSLNCCQEDNACYSCLKDYRNMYAHSELNRGAAKEAIKWLIETCK